MSIKSYIVDTDGFLSTPSARRATWLPLVWCPCVGISIHALREEGDGSNQRRNSINIISIHALREEGDLCRSTRCGSPLYFYPRPPRGGRRVLVSPNRWE